VVCGVDGTIYTLEAGTGTDEEENACRPEACNNNGDDMDDGMSEHDKWDDELYGTTNDHHHEEQQTPPHERIIPGLDGGLYSLIDSQHLDMIPIDIQDVIDSPVSICR